MCIDGCDPVRCRWAKHVNAKIERANWTTFVVATKVILRMTIRCLPLAFPRIFKSHSESSGIIVLVATEQKIFTILPTDHCYPGTVRGQSRTWRNSFCNVSSPIITLWTVNLQSRPVCHEVICFSSFILAFLSSSRSQFMSEEQIVDIVCLVEGRRAWKIPWKTTRRMRPNSKMGEQIT